MPQTLLLVDDSLTIQRVIELTFADQDVHVVAVSSGEQAIARLDEAPPDIVLADVGMPGANGYEVARHIHQDPRLKNIPVVLLSGAFEPVDDAKAREVGCDGILAKPFEPPLVIATVKELLARSKRSGESETPAALPVNSPDGGRPPEPAAVDVRPAPMAPLDDYFDRLDAAFATLTAASAPNANAPRLTSPSAVDSGPETTVAEPGLPPLAEAFAALLAAEDATTNATLPPYWPAGATRPAAALSDQAIDQIVNRVLARLSDRISPRNIGRIVEDVAERVVREEIERLKSSIP